MHQTLIYINSTFLFYCFISFLFCYKSWRPIRFQLRHRRMNSIGVSKWHVWSVSLKQGSSRRSQIALWRTNSSINWQITNGNVLRGVIGVSLRGRGHQHKRVVHRYHPRVVCLSNGWCWRRNGQHWWRRRLFVVISQLRNAEVTHFSFLGRGNRRRCAHTVRASVGSCVTFLEKCSSARGTTSLRVVCKVKETNVMALQYVSNFQTTCSFSDRSNDFSLKI